MATEQGLMAAPRPVAHPAGPVERPVRLAEADLDWLLALMDVPSVSPLEGGDPAQAAAAQRVFAAGAVDRGFAVRLHAAPRPEEIAGPHLPAGVRAALARPGWLNGQPSVVVALGAPQPARRRLVLNFHIDTVGPHLPPRRAGRILHGRGAADDKGPGVAAVAGVAAAFAEYPWLAGEIEVEVASVPGEEGGAMGVHGTRWLVEGGFTGRLMVFAEPTGLEAYDACGATMTARVSVTGRDSTDDHPDRGHNATLALAVLAEVIARDVVPLAERLGAKACLAGLHTGHSHNRVYGTGQLLLNLGYFQPSHAPVLEEQVALAVRRAANQVRGRHAGTRAFHRLLADWPQVVRLDWLKRGLPPLANRDPAMEAVLARAGLPRRDALADGLAFTCDAIWAAGPNRYVIACGPGTLDGCGAHTDTEHIDIDELDRYATRIRDLVVGFAAQVRTEESGTTPEVA
jgi:acetylornithine deacetylase